MNLVFTNPDKNPDKLSGFYKKMGNKRESGQKPGQADRIIQEGVINRMYPDRDRDILPEFNMQLPDLVYSATIRTVNP